MKKTKDTRPGIAGLTGIEPAGVIGPADDPEYVVLRRDDFERLKEAAAAAALPGDDAAEEAADIAALERFYAEDDGETLPAEMVKRLLDGHSPVRVWREHRGLTGARLGAKAGLGQAYISQIETGSRTGSLAALRAIAKALGVSVEDLLPAGD